jgi:CRISPR-associated helicase Cas3/CRISPR-associated endonuclease Cas3-HD
VYYAHSARQRPDWEPLREHLHLVGERAAGYAAVFDAAEEARLAGLLHDLGKYSELFTRRLEAPHRVKGLDHWSLGAWVAIKELRLNGLAAALAIQGHHVGLQRADDDAFRELDPRRLRERHPLNLTLTESDASVLLDRFQADGLGLPVVQRSLFDRETLAAGAMLDVRMLFSALVDADFIETEAHFHRAPDGTRTYRAEGPPPGVREALTALTEQAARLQAASDAAENVLSLRADLLRACLEAGKTRPGLFTLSAPTGAGKTLAMLAFALRHASEHGLRRVVVAAPYLSIIEQTASVYRTWLGAALGEDYVLEDHSLVDVGSVTGHKGAGVEVDERDGTRHNARLLAENWDAPLIVTTNVQLLESLFSNRPSSCRKLHRLARSVILLDEVQTLPPRLAVPTLATLSRLAERYGSSVVFVTATQPAFDHLDGEVRKLVASGWSPIEVVTPSLRLFDRARRVRVTWREAPLAWSELAQEVVKAGSVLCILNLKRHAGALAERLKEQGIPGLFHLSTNLCPAHRKRVLEDVKARLGRRDPCVLISTQCVEAGVDLDFPVVYRAFGPLDSIAQAAGRCNRNGRLPRLGEVRVFLPEEEKYPGGEYANAARVARMLWKSRGAERMDIDAPELFRAYYRALYDLTQVAENSAELRNALADRDFEEVARRYRLIEQDAINVLVPYDPEAFTSLRSQLDQDGQLNRGWIRKTRPHAVSIFRPKREAAIWSFLKPAPLRSGEESDDWFVYLEGKHYDRELMGLTAAPDFWIA